MTRRILFANNQPEIILAVQSNNIDRVRTLLDQNPHININDRHTENGDTALIIASGNHNNQIVNLLIDRGADINLQNNHGQTALLIATSISRNSMQEGTIVSSINIIRSLIQNGANVNILNNNDQGFLQLFLPRVMNEQINEQQDHLNNIRSENLNNVMGYFLNSFLHPRNFHNIDYINDFVSQITDEVRERLDVNNLFRPEGFFRDQNNRNVDFFRNFVQQYIIEHQPIEVDMTQRLRLLAFLRLGINIDHEGFARRLYLETFANSEAFPNINSTGNWEETLRFRSFNSGLMQIINLLENATPLVNQTNNQTQIVNTNLENQTATTSNSNPSNLNTISNTSSLGSSNLQTNANVLSSSTSNIGANTSNSLINNSLTNIPNTPITNNIATTSQLNQSSQRQTPSTTPETNNGDDAWFVLDNSSNNKRQRNG